MSRITSFRLALIAMALFLIGCHSPTVPKLGSSNQTILASEADIDYLLDVTAQFREGQTVSVDDNIEVSEIPTGTPDLLRETNELLVLGSYLRQMEEVGVSTIKYVDDTWDMSCPGWSEEQAKRASQLADRYGMGGNLDKISVTEALARVSLVAQVRAQALAYHNGYIHLPKSIATRNISQAEKEVAQFKEHLETLSKKKLDHSPKRVKSYARYMRGLLVSYHAFAPFRPDSNKRPPLDVKGLDSLLADLQKLEAYRQRGGKVLEDSGSWYFLDKKTQEKEPLTFHFWIEDPNKSDINFISRIYWDWARSLAKRQIEEVLEYQK